MTSQGNDNEYNYLLTEKTNGMILFIGFVFALVLFYLWIKPRFSSMWNLPGPKVWPFLGHTPYYFLSDDHVGIQLNWAKQFHKQGLFKTRSLFHGREVVHIVKTEWAKYIWQRPDMFRRTDAFKTFFPLLRNGLLIATGNDHRFQKKILSKAFTKNSLESYVPVFDRHAKIWCKILDSKVKGHKNGVNIDVREYTNNFSFNILGEVAFSYDFKSNPEAPNTFLQVMESQSATLGNNTTKMLIGLFPFLIKLPGVKEKFTGEQGSDALDEVLLTRKNKVEKGMLTESEKNDLLSIMMTQKDEKTGRMFTDKEIKDNCFCFMLAGHETIGTAIPIALYHMAQYPQMQEKIRQEAMEKFPSMEDEIQIDDLALPMMNAFLKESLRFFPTSTSSQRVSEVDCTFGDYRIPKGTHIIIHSNYLNRDPEQFNSPDKFIPERFTEKGNVKCGTSFSFGYGPFNCIGKTFALLEMKTMIARLLQRFRFTIDDEFNERFTERKQFIAIRTTPPITIRFHELAHNNEYI